MDGDKRTFVHRFQTFVSQGEFSGKVAIQVLEKAIRDLGSNL
jgi:hypothetical protein